MSKTQHEISQNISPLEITELLKPEQLNERTLNDMHSGSGVLVEALLKENMDYLFGYPGGAVLPLYNTFCDGKIKHILVRHERGAVHATEGYARVSGKTGVVIVTSGPGATNVMTGITNAHCGSLPPVVFAGQVATPGIGKSTFQETDILSMTSPITKQNCQVKHVEDIPKIVHEALHVANSGCKGPVVIDFPKDMGVLATNANLYGEINIPGYEVVTEPEDKDIDTFISLLKGARKPVVLAGADINQSKSNQLLTQFVNRYQVPAVTTLLGLSAVPYEDTLFLDVGGIHGSYTSSMALTECGLFINSGSRLDDRLASKPDVFVPNAKIVYVDIDPSGIDRAVHVDLGIIANCKRFLECLNNKDVKTIEHSDWVEHCQNNKQKHPFRLDEGDRVFCKPQQTIEYIGGTANGEVIVTTDMGQHRIWAAQFCPFENHGQWVTSGGLGTMGFGIPPSIGTKLVNPGRTIICFVGDDGLQMINQEMILLPEYGLDVKIVLINNGMLGMVKRWQGGFFNQRFSHSAFNDQPDFMEMVEAYGVKGFLVDKPEQLEEQLDTAFAYQGPALVEVHISPAEAVNPMVPGGKSDHEVKGL